MRGPPPSSLPMTPPVFRVRDAQAFGLSAKRLRARDLDASIWGTRSTAAQASLIDRCRAFAVRYPSGCFSHATAALLLGAPLPWAIERDQSVHIAVRAPHRAPHARGVVGHRLPARLDDVRPLQGVPVTSATWTWLDLAKTLTLADLVAVGDFFIHRKAPLTSVAELEQALRHVPRTHGAAKLELALMRLSDAAESRPESLLRVLFADAGLPSPRINHTMVSSTTGREVRTDFAWQEQRVIVEYQGDYHRSRAQWRADMRRRSALEAQGWTVIEVNWDDVLDPIPLLTRLRALLAE